MAIKDDNEIRFAVGAPNNPLSLAWRLWTLNDNIYIGAKNGNDVVKISLNEEKEWRIAYVKSLNQNDSNDDTVIHLWNKPISTSPEFIHCMTIIVPFIDDVVAAQKNKAEDARIIWTKGPKEGYGTIFKIILSWPRMKKLELGGVMKEGDILIGSIKKQNGEKVWLLANELYISPEQSDAIASFEIKDKSTISSKLLIAINTKIAVNDQPTVFDIALNK